MGAQFLNGRLPFKYHGMVSRLFLVIILLGGLFSFVPEVSSQTSEAVLTNSCIHCHRSLEEERLRKPVSLWSSSVHAEVGNTCEGCHGGDPGNPGKESMSKENNFQGVPEEDQVTEFCGKCHQQISELFMTSEHWKTGAQNCVKCHGSHTIQRVSVDIITPEKCTECHDYEKPDRLKHILQSLHGQFHDSENKLKLISGFPTESFKSDLDDIRKKLRQVRMITHTFKTPIIFSEAIKVNKELGETSSEINRILGLMEMRKILGYFTVSIFSLLAVITYFYNR